MNPFPVVWADLRRNRWGVVATIVLIAVAVALGVAVSAQERALRVGSARAAAPFDLLVGAPGSETQLVLSTVYLQVAALPLMPAGVLADLTARDDVAWAAPIGFGDSWQGHPVIGTIVELARGEHGAPPAEGRLFERLDEAVVGAEVRLAVGDSFAPAHGQVTAEADDEEHHHGFAYRVVGRMAPRGSPWDRAILVPIEAVWWVHGLPFGHAVDQDVLYPAGTGAAPNLAAVPLGPPWDRAELSGLPAIVVKPTSFAAAYALRQAFRDRDDTMAVFPAEVLVQLYRLLGDVRDLMALVSVVTQALVIAASLLAVLATLATRRRLLAVLRALGASRWFVFTVVWTGVALMLLAGALLGLLLGAATAHLLSWQVQARTAVALPVAIGMPELRLVATVALVGLALAALPAALAYRQPVAEGLRSG